MSSDEPLRDAAQSVLDNWESGDLAGAVRDLDAALKIDDVETEVRIVEEATVYGNADYDPGAIVVREIRTLYDSLNGIEWSSDEWQLVTDFFGRLGFDDFDSPDEPEVDKT